MSSSMMYTVNNSKYKFCVEIWQDLVFMIFIWFAYFYSLPYEASIYQTECPDNLYLNPFSFVAMNIRKLYLKAIFCEK